MGKKPEEKAVETTPEAPKATIQSIIAELVMDAELSYDQIVDMVRAKVEGANTSTRSVASVASRLRKAGVDVPTRRATKAAEAK